MASLILYHFSRNFKVQIQLNQGQEFTTAAEASIAPITTIIVMIKFQSRFSFFQIQCCVYLDYSYQLLKGE